MDANEFRKDFIENVKSEAAATGDGSCATFVGNLAKYLIEADVIPDFMPSFYVGTGKNNRRFRVDGYVLDEFDYTMNLVIADYNGNDDERVLTKSDATQLFGRIAFFVDQAYNSRLHSEIEMSTPCSDLIELLRERKKHIRKYRLMIFTDAEMSGAIKTLDAIEIEGIAAECQIWDIDRLFRVSCSDLGRQIIEIDFREYTSNGIPCRSYLRKLMQTKE